MANKMKKAATVGEYEVLIEYFQSVRTHAVGTKYGLIELSKTMSDDFMDCVSAENRLVMTNFEIDQYIKRIDTLKKVFDFTMFIHEFCESEIIRFKRELAHLTEKGDDEKIN